MQRRAAGREAGWPPSLPATADSPARLAPRPPFCRVESIMVSAPPLIAWKYNVQPAAGSEEERLVEVLRRPREWV